MLSEIIGHSAPLQVLRRAVVTGRVTHAYLFVGPPNVGKALTALQFAKALNCERHPSFATAAEVDCCDECWSCTQLDSLSHPDFRLVQPTASILDKGEQAEGSASPPRDTTGEADGEQPSPLEETEGRIEFEGSEISVRQIAELVGGSYSGKGGRVDVSGHAALKISRARTRVYLILTAERLHVAAANRLLKTLEEPPPNTVFILTTANASRVLPTIVSRCQVVRFHPVPHEVAEPALVSRFGEADPALVRTIVALSGGRAGWAHRLLQHPQALAVRADLMDACRGLRNMEQFECLRLGERVVDAAEAWWRATAADEDLAEKALKKARDRVLRTCFPDVLDLLASWFRDLVLAAADAEAPQIINQDLLADLRRTAPLYSPEACRKVCLFIEDLKGQLRQNANVRLAAEVLALRMLTA